jgi:hypothetical protein
MEKVMALREQAIQERLKAGDETPDRSVDRMVMSRAPMQSVFGRQLSMGELSKVNERLTDADREKVASVENAFAQYAATVGSSAPASLTTPKLSRKDAIPSGYGRGYSGATSLSRPAFASYAPTRMRGLGSRRPARMGLRRAKLPTAKRPRKMTRVSVRKPKRLRGLRGLKMA